MKTNDLIKLIKQKEKINKKWVFDYDTKFTQEILEILSGIKSDYILHSLFKKIPSKDRRRVNYFVQIKCCNCQSNIDYSASKGKLIKIINSNFNVLCDTCIEKDRIEQSSPEVLERKRLLEKENQSQEKENQKNRNKKYIDQYLNPNHIWGAKVKLYQKWKEINQYGVDKDIVAKYIIKMSYKEFLSTPYWNAVAFKVKADSHFKCKLCGSNSGLSTHHSTYEHHGYEHVYWKQDLICLCSGCHEKFHDNNKLK